MVTIWEQKINEMKVEKKLLEKSQNSLHKELSDLEKNSNLLQQAKEIFQKSALLTQNHLAEHLSKIVTKAIRSVFFEKNVEFKVEFKEQRNKTECEMYIIENGEEYSLTESRGYGMTDIVSFALRVAYILLHSSENILIIDEPFRNLDKDKHEYASLMVKELSRELSMQFIICTHMEILQEHADKKYRVKQKKGESSVLHT